MPARSDADRLAEELFETRSRLRSAGRALHDQVGPLLSAVGIRVGLLRADHPQAAPEAGEALAALDEAMERVRALSRELNPPPAAHLGLKRALASLAETHSQRFGGAIRFSYTASAEVPDDAAAAMYDTVSAVLERATADRSATRISMAATGARVLTVRIESDGRAGLPRSALTALSRRARPAGIVLDSTTKRGTIVSIRYAARRPAGG